MAFFLDESNFKKEILRAEHREAIDVPKNLSEMERIMLLIQKGCGIQHEYVFRQLNIFILEKRYEDCKRMLKMFVECKAEIRLDIILQNIAELETLLAENLIRHAHSIVEYEIIIPFITAGYGESVLMNQAMEMCRFSRPTEIRLFGIQILIAMAASINVESLHDSVTSKIRALCQDTDFVVRQFLIILVHKLLSFRYKSDLIVELIELMVDEELVVRSDSCVVASQFIHQVVDKESKQRIILRILKFVKEKPYQNNLSRHICDILEYGDMPIKDSEILINILHELLSQEITHAIEIIPRVSAMMRKYPEPWSKINIEYEILEICKLKNIAVLSMVCNSFSNLQTLPFKAESIATMVECCMNGNISTKFQLLKSSVLILSDLTHRALPLNTLDRIKERLCSLIKWEKDIWGCYAWRDYLDYLESYITLLKFVNFEFSELSLIAMTCFEIVSRHTFIQIRKTAISLLLSCINHTKVREQRDIYVRRIIQDWRHSPSIYKRQYYCDMLSVCVFNGFANLFKESFAKEINSLIREPYIETKLRCLELLSSCISWMTIDTINDCIFIIDSESFRTAKSLLDSSAGILKLLVEYKELYQPDLIRDSSQNSLKSKRSVKLVTKYPRKMSTSANIKPRKSVDKTKIVKSSTSIKY